MLENSRPGGAARRHRVSQAGTAAVEFAVVVTLFLTFIFAAIEMARAMYVFNTLQEATRSAASAAANTDFHDETAKDRVRQNAIFRSSPGMLMLGDPVTDQHIRIDYLALPRGSDGSMTLTPIPAGSMPSCPANNRIICMANPNDPGCIRLVRVRVCQPSADQDCAPVRYQTIFPFVDLPLDLPTAPTIVPAETLGHKPGALPCP